jgi:hypothetical protein
MIGPTPFLARRVDLAAGRTSLSPMRAGAQGQTDTG